ncbi:hypothetical protein M885DRAFT_539348 [Pelagophyceae sp. CCMP2097]|nr:hypothetical protein M885DRAFT_539348 [Pelagophyceae sp. CCMP2097]
MHAAPPEIDAAPTAADPRLPAQAGRSSPRSRDTSPRSQPASAREASGALWRRNSPPGVESERTVPRLEARERTMTAPRLEAPERTILDPAVEIYLGKSAARAVAAARARNARPRTANALGETLPRQSDFGPAQGDFASASAPAPAADDDGTADAQGAPAPLLRRLAPRPQTTPQPRPRTTPQQTKRRVERGWDERFWYESGPSALSYDAAADVHCTYALGAAFAASSFCGDRRFAAAKIDDLVRVPRAQHIFNRPVAQHHYQKDDFLPPWVVVAVPVSTALRTRLYCAT